ncbi:MAG: autotransporter domain-containing protein [Rhizobiaceae bacterium]
MYEVIYLAKDDDPGDYIKDFWVEHLKPTDMKYYFEPIENPLYQIPATVNGGNPSTLPATETAPNSGVYTTSIWVVPQVVDGQGRIHLYARDSEGRPANNDDKNTDPKPQKHLQYFSFLKANDGNNDAPQFSSTAVTDGHEGNFYTYDITVFDPNIGDTLTLTDVSSPAPISWLSITKNNDTSFTLSGTPPAGAAGTHDVKLELSDGLGGVANQEFTITVTGDAPTFTIASPLREADVLTPYSVDITTFDMDDEDVTIRFVDGPSWLNITSTTNDAVNGTASAQLFGTSEVGDDIGSPFDVVLRVSETDDPASYTQQTFQLTVTDINDRPTFVTTSPLRNAEKNVAYSLTIKVKDPDHDDVIISKVNGPGWIDIDASGTIDNGDGTASATLVGTPTQDSDVGTWNLELKVEETGGELLSQNLVFQISVVDAVDSNPTFTTNDPLAIAVEHADYSQTIETDYSGVNDVDITIFDGPDWIDIGTTTNNGDGTASATLSGAPGDYDIGDTIELVLRVADVINAGSYTDKSFNLVVKNINDAPLFIEIDPFEIREDEDTDSDRFLVSTLHFADLEEDDAATFDIIEDPSGVFEIGDQNDPAEFDQLYISQHVALDHESNPRYTVKVRVTDAGTSWDTGTEAYVLDAKSRDETLIIDITNVNEAPTEIALANDKDEVSEEIVTTNRVLVDDLTMTDPENDNAVSYTIESGDMTIFEIGSRNEAGVDIFGLYVKQGVDLTGQAGTDYTLNIEVTDDGTTYDEETGIDDPDPATFAQDLTISVVADNTAPIANGDTVTGDEDSVVTIELSGSDSDGTVDEYKLTQLPPAAVGILYSDNPPNNAIPVNTAFDSDAATKKINIYYKAVNDNDFADTLFKFVAIDNEGAESAPATIDILMQSVNDVPTFTTTDPLPGAEQGTYYDEAIATLDVERDNVVITKVAAEAPSWLIVGSTTNNADGTASAPLTGTPGPGDFGTNINVKLRVEEVGDANSYTEKTYKISVTNVNDLPTFTTGDPLPGATQDSYYDETIATEDLDGDSVVITKVAAEAPSWLIVGSTTNNADGTASAPLTGTPGPGDVGTNINVKLRVAETGDTNNYTEKTYKISVANVNDLPTFTTGDPLPGAEQGTYYDETIATEDLDGDSVVITKVAAEAPSWLIVGSTTNNADGTASAPLTGTPGPGDVGTNINVKLRVEETGNASNYTEKTYKISVANVNDAPVISAPNNGNETTFNINEGITAVTDVDATDIDLDEIDYNIVANFGDAGLFEIDQDSGVLKFQSAPDFENPADVGKNNVYDVKVEATDGALNDTQIIHVNIVDVDEIPPTVELSAPDEVRDQFVATVTFSEPVNGFIQDELTIENATIANFTGADGDTDYVFTLDPIEMGKIKLSVAAGVAADLIGNLNLASPEVVLDYVDEDVVLKQTTKVLSNLLTQRARITMSFQPDFGRRLSRLSGNYQNNGGFSAFGLTYKDGRLPAHFTHDEDKLQFSYSLRQSLAAAGPPSLTGRLATDQLGLPSGSRQKSTHDPLEPPKLTNSFSHYGAARDRKNNTAVNQYWLDQAQATSGHYPLRNQLGGGDGSGNYSSNSGRTDIPSHALTAGPKRPTLLSKAEFDARHAPSGSGTNNTMDVWMEGAYGEFEADENEGVFGIVHFGADYLVTPDVLFGVGGQVDWIESESTADNSEVEGLGFMIGPYVTARLDPKLLFDGRLAWGQSTNDVSPFGSYTDEVESERLLATGALIGQFEFTDSLTMLPEARLSWYHEETDAYFDFYGIIIPSTSVETGTLEFGPTFRGNFDLATQGMLQPFVGAKGIWTFAHDLSEDDKQENPPQADEGVRARVEMGVDVRDNLAEGLLISLSGFYDGIGDNDYEVWGGKVWVNQAF